MVQIDSQKNNIVLSDYNYKIDIAQRLFLASLESAEIDLLHELLNHALEFSLHDFIQSLEFPAPQIRALLEKCAEVQLLKLDADRVLINREARKAYSVQLAKFRQAGVPGLDHLQQLLYRVPLHLLPNWYALPRDTDDLFGSIIEKHFGTPKAYETYLSQLTFSDPTLAQITQAVYSAPTLEVEAHRLREQLGLSPARFEECLLQLEFQLICCLSYRRQGSDWVAILSPFMEWQHYQSFLTRTAPRPLPATAGIDCYSHREFGFVQDLAMLLSLAEETPLALNYLHDMPNLINALTLPEEVHERYLERLLSRLLSLDLVEASEGLLYARETAYRWHQLPIQDQALEVYRASREDWEISDRDQRSVEWSLRSVSALGWVYVEDFIESFTAPIGQIPPVRLQQHGAKWTYTLPKHSEAEHVLIHRALWRLFEAGLVDLGSAHRGPCFRVTPFGRMIIEP